MKNKMHILASFLLIFAMAGCGKGTKNVDTIAGDKDPFGKYEEGTSIELVRTSDATIDSTILAHYQDETLTENRFSQLYRDRLNLDIRYKFIASDKEDYQNKINLAMTANELPEFLICDTNTAKKLYEADCLKPMDEIFTDYASPLLKEITGENELKAATFDGKLYGVPQMFSTIDRTQYLYVRTDWVRKLNKKNPSLNLKEKPETIEDLEKLALAFLNEDPDGNNRKDTQGILFQGDIWNSLGGLTPIFNAFDSYPNVWVPGADGKLVYGSTQNTTKNALSKLREWYKNGIISREFVSHSSSNIASKLTQGKAGLFFCEQWGCQYPLQDVFNVDDTADWTAVPLVTGTDHKAKSQVTMGTYGWWVATKKASRPEAIVKLMNVYLDSIWGENADFEKYYMPSDTGASVWKLSPVTPEPPTKNLDAYLAIKKAVAESKTAELTGEAKQIYNQINQYKHGNTKLWSWHKGYDPEIECVFEVMNYYVENNLIMYDGFNGSPSDTMSEKMTLVQKEQNKVFVNIITGTNELDSFDAFINTFSRLGGDAMTEEVNKAK